MVYWPAAPSQFTRVPLAFLRLFLPLISFLPSLLFSSFLRSIFDQILFNLVETRHNDPLIAKAIPVL